MRPLRQEQSASPQPDPTSTGRTPRRLPPSEVWRKRQEESPEPRKRRGRLWLVVPFVLSLLAGLALVGVFAVAQDLLHRPDFTGDACFVVTILAALAGFTSGREGWDRTMRAWMRRELGLSYQGLPVALISIALVALVPTVTWVVLAATGY